MTTLQKREEKSSAVTRDGVTVNDPEVHMGGTGSAAVIGCSITAGDLTNSNFTALGIKNYFCTHGKSELDGPTHRSSRKAAGVGEDKTTAIRKTFVETEAFREVRRVLQAREFLTIVGAPGEGKTTIALKLALDHADHNVYHFKSLSELDLSDIKEREKPTFVILDNLFGKVTLSRSELAKWQIALGEFEELLLRKDSSSEPATPVDELARDDKSVTHQAFQALGERSRENLDMDVSQMMKQVSVSLRDVSSTSDAVLSAVPISPPSTENSASKEMETKGATTLMLSDPSPLVKQEIKSAIQVEGFDEVEEGRFLGTASSVSQPNLKVLFLTRNYVYYEAVKHMGMLMYTLFGEESVLDLSKMGLSQGDRLALLRRYTSVQPLSRETEAAVLATKTPMGFPLCCDLYMVEAKFREKPEEFFRTPLAMLQATLGQLLASDLQVKVSLTLLLLCDGILDLTKLTSPKLRQESGLDILLKKLVHLGDSPVIQPEKIRESLVNLQSSYVRMEGETAGFSHDSVQDAVAFNLGNDYPTFFLEHCSMDLIAKRVRVQDDNFAPVSPTQGDVYSFVIFLSSGHIPVLVHRLFGEMRQGNLREAVACDVLTQPLFVGVFVQELQKAEDCTSLLHCQDNRFERCLLFWLAFIQSETSLCQKCLSQEYFPDNEVYQGICGACLSNQGQFLEPLLEKLSRDGLKKVLTTTVSDILKMRSPEEGFPGDTVVHVASQCGNMQVLQKLKEHLPDDMWQQGFDRPGAYQWTPMLYACATGHTKIVQFLLEEGADSMSKSASGNSAIHIASLHGWVSVVRCLIEHNDPCDLLGTSDCTPLMYACGRGHTDVVEYLLNLEKNSPEETSSDQNHQPPAEGEHCLPGSGLELGRGSSHCVDINRRDDGGCTALMWSCRLGHRNVSELLLSRGADPTLVDDRRRSCLHAASCAGDVEMVALLIEHRLSINAEDSKGWTPLHLAVHNAKLAVLQVLLDSGADPAKETADGHSTAALAIRSGEVNTVNLLEKSDYDLGLCDLQKNWTLLQHCCREGHQQMAEWLWHQCQWTVVSDVEAAAAAEALVRACRRGWLDLVKSLVLAGVDVNTEKGEKGPPIIAATKGGHLAVVKFLLDHKADSGASCDEGNTSIHIACMAGHLDILCCLLDHGVDIDKRGYEGITPLLYASYTGHSPLVSCLLDRGANASLTVPATNSNSLHVACHAGHVRVVKMLLDHKVPVNCQTIKGLTPYDLALKAGHGDVCKLLCAHGGLSSDSFGTAV